MDTKTACIEIKFGDGYLRLDEYESLLWYLNESRRIEFFPETFVLVTLISVESPLLEALLDEFGDHQPLALDLEWDTELCLFQICSENRALVIRHPKGPGNQILKKFLQNHKFYAKGIENDVKMLSRKFNDGFSSNIEDIAQTRLRPYGHSVNFIEMVSQFAGTPTVQFKDSRIGTSDWGRETLTMRQVLYAAYDVVALSICYPNFPQPCSTTESAAKKNKKKNTEKIQREAVWTPVPLRPTFSYILRNYTDSTLPIALRSRFRREELDYVHAWKGLVFVSLYSPLNRDEFSCEVEEIPPVDLSLTSDSDDFYVTEIPDELHSKSSFNLFMYSFGVDHIVNVFATYVRVSCKTAVEAHRFRTFVPNLEINGKRMVVSNFPFFLKSVCLKNLPSDMTHKELYKLVSSYGTIKSQSIKKHAKVVFSSDESADAAVAGLDGRVIRGSEIHATRRCDKKHVMHIRRFQLFCTDCCDRAELKRRFAAFGRLFSVDYNNELGISVVQFMSKADAIRASSPTAFIGDKHAMILIRGVSCDTADTKVINILSRFGRVLDISSQQKSKTTRTLEILFENAESAKTAQIYLQNFNLDGCSWSPADVDTAKCVPSWKIALMNHWISLKRDTRSESEMLDLVSPYGDVIDATMNERNIYVMFAAPEQATAAYNALHESHKASYLGVPQFVNNTNSSDMKMELAVLSVKDTSGSDAVTVDPIPRGFTESDTLQLCGENSRVFITPSRREDGRHRMVVFSRTPVERVRTFEILSQASIMNNWSALPVLERVTDVEKPAFSQPMRNRMMLVIEPVPDDFEETTFAGIISEFGAFQVTSSSRYVVIQAKNVKPIKNLFRFLKCNNYNVTMTHKHPRV